MYVHTVYTVYIMNIPHISEQICLCSFYFGLSTVLKYKKNTPKMYKIFLMMMVENGFFN